ncbi:helix-turn-helix domain-containing protein [Bradyrhizobium sp. A5]|uniref:helix-turn-helix domain-containing protein n=1 Tax=Bradyrhizobium sp. A5 TaxID=3133696 RepID=UPI0032504D66
MAKASRAARIKAALDVAYGTRGLSKMAADAGISKQLLSFIVAGDREVTDDVYRKIAEALLLEADRQRAAANKIDHIAGRMLAELEE